MAIIEAVQTPAPVFGDWAALYRRYRPHYPAAVFEQLKELVGPARDSCIELGSGSGQATGALLGLFEWVMAVEPNPEMAHAAPLHPRQRRFLSEAESFEAGAHSADAVVLATSFHWMQMDAVAAQAAEWLRPGGVFYAFSYGAAQYPDAPAAVQAVFRRHLQAWRPHVDSRLSSWRPYEEPLVACGRYTEVARFEMYADHHWDPEEAAGFFMTTSYGQAFARATGDADAHRRQLADEIATAAKGRLITARFPIEGAYGRTPAGPIGS
jgi:SAM-dependent methyltransferase